MSTTTTHIEKKKMLAPKLRFKDFGEPWLNKLYGDIYSFYTTNSFSRDNLNYESGVVKNIHYGDIHTKFTTLFDIKKEQVPFVNTEINLSKINQDSFCKERDLVVADASEDYADIGKTIELVNLNNEKVIAGLHTFLVRPNKHEMAKGFAGYLVQSWKFRKQVMIIAQGTKVLSLSTGRLANLKLNIPTLPEQQKIATFLSAIDEKIQQLTRKKELLELYKKGVMQRLFLSESMSELGLIGFKDDRIPEDETNPKILSSKKSQFRPLRFKDENGKAYPRWEEKLYEDIFSFYTTNSFSRENLNYETGEVKNIHYGDIHTKFSSRFEVNEEVVPYINANIDLSKVKEENYCQEGDLVIADASEDYADIGKTIELIKLNKEKVVAGLHTFLARPNNSKMHKGFSGYLVQAPYVRKQVMTIAQGTKVLSLSPGRLGKVKLKVPCLEEQQKIASYLSSIDTKIESVATQIAQSQTFKKGLLQQMFV